MTTHSSILAWKIPWTEERGRPQSMGSQRVRHDSTHTRLRTELSSKFSLTILLFSFYSISLGWDGIPNLLLPLFLSQVFFIINWLQSHSLLASASYKNKTERKKKKNTTKQNTNFLKISQHLDLRLPLTHL